MFLDEPSSFTIRFPFLAAADFRFLTVGLRKRLGREYIRRDNPVADALLSKMRYNERVAVKREFLRLSVRLELDEAKQRLLVGLFETYLRLSEEEERQL
ncbi:hypothetical protein M493_16610 [Geobacillus genomosp. 3]|uniref:Uncharacterized protein n=1 Tax=Geobacillus genomosp. 3 TaxID=1921421 RepID=S5Z3A0_GEOG3|nr:hypothetical protein M493_16610 [Geobacillus genomosp. 3]